MHKFLYSTLEYFKTQRMICGVYYFFQIILCSFLYYLEITTIYEPTLIFYYAYPLWFLVSSYVFYVVSYNFVFVDNYVQTTYVVVSCIASTLLWHYTMISLEGIEMTLFYFASIVTPPIYNFIIPIIISFPFKLVSIVCGLKNPDIYFSQSPKEIENIINKYNEKSIYECYRNIEETSNFAQKIKESLDEYNRMNETELEARLNEAVEREDYETAEKIKNILNKKFPKN